MHEVRDRFSDKLDYFVRLEKPHLFGAIAEEAVTSLELTEVFIRPVRAVDLMITNKAERNGHHTPLTGKLSAASLSFTREPKVSRKTHHPRVT
jgi:hypothetical protein